MKNMSNKLTEIIPYKKTVWVTGFIKTTLSSALISTGVVLITNGISNHPLLSTKWTELDIVVGLVSIFIAIAIVLIIDDWKEARKKEELETIDAQINARAEEIAVEKVLKKLNQIEEE